MLTPSAPHLLVLLFHFPYTPFSVAPRHSIRLLIRVPFFKTITRNDQRRHSDYQPPTAPILLSRHLSASLAFRLSHPSLHPSIYPHHPSQPPVWFLLLSASISLHLHSPGRFVVFWRQPLAPTVRLPPSITPPLVDHRLLLSHFPSTHLNPDILSSQTVTTRWDQTNRTAEQRIPIAYYRPPPSATAKLHIHSKSLSIGSIKHTLIATRRPACPATPGFCTPARTGVSRLILEPFATRRYACAYLKCDSHTDKLKTPTYHTFRSLIRHSLFPAQTHLLPRLPHSHTHTCSVLHDTRSPLLSLAVGCLTAVSAALFCSTSPRIPSTCYPRVTTSPHTHSRAQPRLPVLGLTIARLHTPHLTFWLPSRQPRTAAPPTRFPTLVGTLLDRFHGLCSTSFRPVRPIGPAQPGRLTADQATFIPGRGLSSPLHTRVFGLCALKHFGRFSVVSFVLFVIVFWALWTRAHRTLSSPLGQAQAFATHATHWPCQFLLLFCAISKQRGP
ncbi:hypothetical protein LIA77_05418 [Sarocladium implicatum]|nr:hypothetical protein LIA77_05418 [Sarocladium implicatum]